MLAAPSLWPLANSLLSSLGNTLILALDLAQCDARREGWFPGESWEETGLEENGTETREVSGVPERGAASSEGSFSEETSSVVCGGTKSAVS